MGEADAGPSAAEGRDPPDLRIVALGQARLVGLARRRELLLVGGVTAALVLGELMGAGRSGAGPGEPASVAGALVDAAYGLLLLVAALWPASVWSDEGPTGRTYHWTLPVGRRAHDLLRVSAGCVWFLGAVAAGAAVGLAVGASVHGLPPAGPLPAVAWSAAGLLIVYSLCSVAAVLSDHPFRWIVGVPVLYVALRMLVRAGGLEGVHETLEAIVSGRLGLLTALWVPYRAAGSVELPLFRTDVPGAAVAVWLLAGVAAVVVAASVHREAPPKRGT